MKKVIPKPRPMKPPEIFTKVSPVFATTAPRPFGKTASTIIAKKLYRVRKPISLASPQHPRALIFRHANEFRRAFVAWAVSQHPYHKPPELFKAMEYFIAFMAGKGKWRSDVISITIGQLRKAVFEFCKSNPYVVRWNKPRRGKHTHVFVSRHDQPHPDYDFIDLDALAMNIVQQLRKED